MIKVFTTRFDFDHYRSHLSDQKIGLVPTMGNLHKGHISLVEKSTEENDVTIITIFVNPTQFGPGEDYTTYPRTLDDDLAKISSLALLITPKKDIVVYAPGTIAGVYPDGFTTSISVGDIKNILEGTVRPTHFDGVSTVVYRLFKITNPHNAYFGQKDYQQCLVIKKMVEDLELPVKIHALPIVRNSEGLALSSRNQYLNEQERVEALVLPRTLQKIEKLIRTHQDYKSFVSANLENDKHWDYLKILDSKNLQEPTDKTSELIIVAVYRLGKTRLLDNILVPVLAGK